MSLPRLSSDQFASALASNPRMVLKFTAAWCGPCKAFAPTVDAVASENPGVAFFEVDLEQEPALARQWNVRSIPTVVGFRDGLPVFQATGALPKQALAQKVHSLG